jgi:hypothetical protein
VRGPLAILITVADDAVCCLDEDPEPAIRAMWMANLAHHVLPARDKFDAWLEEVVVRMIQHHPRDHAADDSFPDDELHLGRPTSRELFDTTHPFDPAREDAQIATFLKSLDSTNPYLLPPP